MTIAPYVVRRGEGIPLIAVHGNGVDHRILLALDECLAEVGQWERIYLDLPGFGRTPPLDNAGGLPEIAEWLCGAVHDLVGDAPYAILASSLGGVLARHLVARMPDQVLGFALIAPAVETHAERRRTPSRTVLRWDRSLIASLPASDARDYEEMAVVQSPETWQRFREWVLPGVRAANSEAMERLARRYELPRAPEDDEPAFAGPSVIVTGRQDHVVGYEDQATLLSHYPRATFVAVDGAGHNVHLEQPLVVEAVLRDWSNRVLASVN